MIFLFLHRGGTEGLYAEVTIQGEKVLEIPLGEKEVPQMWSLQEEFGVPVFLEIPPQASRKAAKTSTRTLWEVKRTFIRHSPFPL